ncbi:MAG: 3'-5' exonuclease [Bdellovibrionota bacterium]
MDFGLVVDLETTGLDPVKDKIIEIGLVEFAVESSKNPVISNIYGALEDPKVSLSPEIVKITGLEDKYLEGQCIDWGIVQKYFDRSSVVIAHNMSFDRSFLQQRQELNLSTAHWACSKKHIDWFAHGFKTRALNYLAADHGFVNSFAHRAVFDCATTLRLITPYLSELIETSYEHEICFSAVGAAFEKKDILREHGYRWNPEVRVWQKSVFEKKADEERAFLANSVYERSKSSHMEEIVS